MSEDKKLTLKQRRWIKEYIDTGNATEAAMKAYDVKDRVTAATMGSENLRKLQISDLMEDMGLTDVALVNVGAKGMTEPVKQSITGEVFPDYAVRHKYWETLLKMKGKLKDNPSINISGEKVIAILSGTTVDVHKDDSNQQDTPAS